MENMIDYRYPIYVFGVNYLHKISSFIMRKQMNVT